MWPFFWAYAKRKRDLTPAHCIRVPRFWRHSILITSLKALSPNIVTSEAGASAYEFWEYNSVHSRASLLFCLECFSRFLHHLLLHFMQVWGPPRTLLTILLPLFCFSPFLSHYSSSSLQSLPDINCFLPLWIPGDRDLVLCCIPRPLNSNLYIARVHICWVKILRAVVLSRYYQPIIQMRKLRPREVE